MADFQLTRQKLNEGRENSEKARLDVSASEHRLRTLEQLRKELLERQKDSDDSELRNRLHDLDGRIAAEKETLGTNRETSGSLKDTLSRFDLEFRDFRDPRALLEEHFSNQTPFLLFPLRLETRFKTVNNK